MLDLIGAMFGMLAVGVSLVAITQYFPTTLAPRLALAAVAGAWIGLASHLGATGKLAFSPGQPVPLIGVLAAAPLVLTGALAFALPKMRAGLLAIPLPVLVGLNSLRILGLLFILLAASGRLSGPFPFVAGFGDMITGAWALQLALRIARSQPYSPATLRRWNAFGALDLVVAIALGLTSAAGSPLRLIDSGAGSEAMQHLPFSLVPSVLVPFYLITHGVIAAKLRAQRATAVTPALRARGI